MFREIPLLVFRLVHPVADDDEVGDDFEIGDPLETRERFVIFRNLFHEHSERPHVEKLAGFVDECAFIERTVDDQVRVFGSAVVFGVASDADDFVRIIIHGSFRIVLVMIIKTFLGNVRWCFHLVSLYR